jgi:23S rRNA (cytosine1962-C5)-methyltransferase
MPAGAPALPGGADRGAAATLTIGRQSAGFVERGHPWIRPDRFTRGLERLRPGDCVDLVDERGQAVATALADPGAAVCARVCGPAGAGFDPAAALERAWTRRQGLHADPATDCYRLVHGEGDGLPGFRVERFGAVVVVEVRAACAVPWTDALCRALAGRLPGARIVVRDHQDDLRRQETRTRAWDGGAVDPAAAVDGRELGCTYRITPFAGLATGLYCDQRATRAWLAGRVAGKRVLNLFAYTGAFAIHALVHGAAQATDVDLAATSLATAAANAAANGVADRHRTVRQDCAAFLRESLETWDVVVCDPPTAAMGAGGWVVRRDYPALLASIRSRLAPDGLLVACCNTVGAPYPLREAVAAAGFRPIEGPAIGIDIPTSKGFPEGRPYRLTAATG